MQDGFFIGGAGLGTSVKVTVDATIIVQMKFRVNSSMNL
jgi:hypothetical protein